MASLRESGNWFISKILVVNNPRGIPSNKQCKKYGLLKFKKSPLKIAKPVPIVNKGPKAKKIESSPRPLLATNLSGLAV